MGVRWADGTVYVVDGNNFYALNGSSGSVNQQRVFTGEEEVSNVAVDNDYGIVYCATSMPTPPT